MLVLGVTGDTKARFARPVRWPLGELDPRQQAMDGIVRPLAETLRRYEEQVRQFESQGQQAYGSVEKAVRAMRDGAHDFLEKPLDLARLRNLVASTLRAREEAPASAALPYRDTPSIPTRLASTAPSAAR